MRRTAQTAIWTFITAYRRHVGESLSYIGLVQDMDRLRQLAVRYSDNPDPALRRAAQELTGYLGVDTTDDEAPEPEKPASAQPTEDRRAGIERDYRALVRDRLQSGTLWGPARKDLDEFCRRSRLDMARAEELENVERRDLGLPPVSWSTELRQNLREQLQLDRGLSERHRLTLFDIYIRRGRLSVAHAQDVIEEEVGDLEAQPHQPARSQRAVWLGAASTVVAALLLVVAWERPSLFAADDDPASRQPAEVQVSGSILEDTLWRAGTTYHLDGIVFVEAGAKLVIEPGTRITGRFGAALVVTRDATLYARGTADAPIVFTTSKSAGERRAGDWGGLVLLGNAPINQLRGQIEGIDRDDARGAFGGADHASNCGVLEYVRIEFAGHEVFANNELNGLTLGGCGANTIIRNVQIHRALDDGLEIFGGTVDIARVLITGAQDDSLDWDMGWQGRGQFIVIQQHSDGGDNAIEADNWRDRPNAAPRSRPTLYNLTLVGSRNPERAQRAMTLRRGTGGRFENVIITGFPLEAVDLRDAVTAALVETNDLSFGPTLLHNIGTTDGGFFAREEDDDGGFEEASWFAANDRVRQRIDPLLPVSAFDPQAPSFVPARSSPAGIGAVAPPKGEFWDEGANYLGALRPGVSTSWLAGWTAYPQN